MAYHFPGAFSGYIPAANGQIVSFARDPAKYKLAKYAQLVKSDAPVGVYLSLHTDDFARVANLDEDVWADGADRPAGNEDGVRQKTTEFQCIRRSRDFRIGWQTIQHASYKVLVAHTTKARNAVMIGSTARMISAAETASNWAGNTATANDLNGGAGSWDQASSIKDDGHYLAIKKTLDEVALQICAGTNGVVDMEEGAELQLVISPRLAVRMSQSDEVHNYLRESPFARSQVEGKVQGQNARWGLPDQIYGWNITIENAIRVSERLQDDGDQAVSSGPAATRAFIKSDDSAIACSRIGGLDGELGGPNFSTFQIFYVDSEMQVEIADDTWHRYTKGSCVTNRIEKVVAPISGFLVQNVLEG